VSREITFEDIKKNEEIRTYIRRADEALCAQGYTEHNVAHLMRVAETVRYIMSTLGYTTREVEVACIAAYLHDIGNLINRVDHSQSGALIAFRLLDRMGMDAEELATIVSAIGNHDEGTAVPVHATAAALILADKSDVRRTRVRNTDVTQFDIHDRVNYSVSRSSLHINEEKNVITLDLTIQTEYGAVMDYFEIFLERMILCKRAAQALGLRFALVINSQQIL